MNYCSLFPTEISLLYFCLKEDNSILLEEGPLMKQ
jgi:hypothetical protein